LSEEQETTLFDALQRKACPEIAAYLAELSLGESERQMFLALAELNGGEEVLPEARAVLTAAEPDVHRALDDLQAIASEVHAQRPQLPLYFDLAELRGYHYHTGAVFAAFSPGHGQEIARGGRYDEIGKVFGRARPATGFSADLKTIMGLGAGSDGVAAGGIYAPAIKDPALHARIHELRAQGERVICELSGQAGDARDMGCDRHLEKHEGAWKLVKL
jgi:ATP phosphoribosyltransferase regulatory subunit